ncbi:MULTISPECIES: LLM class flavin-dependent oxidoreductase [Micromonospora]|uniref:LLM class flavin-dependent oxidoreductase n=1 Tax=Micromonospora TaxID=1873 RepID=UPI000D6F020D|nr:LLM class flavin-dependent oxidoreductase [Micromonospora sp. S4605]PWU47557.1 alkanesulfonate monooxygenase [Micromonospora sp. S4605]
MSLQLYWFIPAHGDGREVARPRAGGPPGVATLRRDPDIDYLSQVAGAVDRLGFAGALVPFGIFCEDPWLVAAALSQRTARLRFMVAFRPGLLSPTLAAQMSATCQRISGGRLLLNVVVGGDPEEQHRYGDWLAHDQRYARADEFLAVLRGAWSGPVDLDGEHYRVAGATVMRRPDPPPIFLGGSSAAAQRVAARRADVFLTWAELPAQTGSLVAGVRALAAEAGREIAFGTRFHVISRDTSEQAWAVADAMTANLDPALVARTQERFRRSDSEGQRRMAALHGGRTDRLEIYPNVWAGYGLVRQGPGITLVGSHDEVADRIAEYHAQGLDHLILSGQPHLEEAYWFGEGVMPALRRRGLLVGPDGPDGPDGDRPDPAPPHRRAGQRPEVSVR